jgi:tetratricopeptide (TPR) repeat protein
VFDDTLKLILALGERRLRSRVPHRLNELFHRLAAAAGAVEASQIEELIWSVWMAHDDPDAEDALSRATQAIAARELEEAEAILDALVALHPDYAEAWNKRATLYFLQRRDEESVADIRRTLELEPRHFGAICGFGQICLRRHDRAGALFAFDAALRVNPHLGSIRAAVKELSDERTGPMQ